MAEPEVRPLPPEEAIRYWGARMPVLPEEFAAMTREERVTAFTVAGFEDLASLDVIHKMIGRALENGTSYQTFQAEAARMMEEGWRVWHVETVFRNAIQGAYAAGRWRQIQEVKESRPYLMYDAVNDSRTRPTHKAMDGKVYPADHPFWNSWYPPNGHRCRCGVITVSAREARAQGLTIEETDPTGTELSVPDPVTGKTSRVPMRPDPGWDHNQAETAWKPDTSRVRADLRQAYLERLAAKACDPETGFADEEAPACPILKKRLRQEDLDALEAVVRAERVKAAKSWEAWAEDAVKGGQAKGEVYPVGNLPARVLDKLPQQPRLALVMMDDQALLHMLRESKAARGVAATLDEIKDFPSRLKAKDTRWFRDKQDGDLLMAWVRDGDAMVKVVIRLDWKQKGTDWVANRVVSAGIVQERNLNPGLYEEL